MVQGSIALQECPGYTFSVEFPGTKFLPSPDDEVGSSASEKEELLDGETRLEPKLSKADKIDCVVAAASGVMTGLIDSFFVGEFSIERASQWGAGKTNEFVLAMAKLSGYEGGTLAGAIKHLEDSFGFAADGNTADFGGGYQHHLRDFSHHFSLGGLICSIFTQFTGKVIGTNTAGNLIVVRVPKSHLKYLGESFSEKIVMGTVLWVMHIASDVAGSRCNPGSGTGVPGPILSLVKAFSALPIFKDARPAPIRAKEGDLFFRELISKLFNGTLFAKRNENGKIVPVRFDFRLELGIVHELGRQSIPVMLNQCFIRSFYFIRRFTIEIKRLKIKGFVELEKIDPMAVLPFRNRAIARMSTISTGVFSSVDMADAVARAAIASRGSRGRFLSEFVVRVNFVGIGTFAVACVLDVHSILKEKRDSRDSSAAWEYERGLSEFGCLELEPNHVRILQSLQHTIVVHDIADTKQLRKKESKRLWLEEWESAIDLGLREKGLTASTYLMDPCEMYALFEKKAKDDSCRPWPFLLALEADLFVPYQPLGGKPDKRFKDLECSTGYMTEVFTAMQSVVSKEDLKGLRKSLKKAEGAIDAKIAKNVAAFVGTGVFAGAATVAAFVFAPYIAPFIAGKAVAGLSGAALTSASLAFVGGGSLAAGGLGMAGGTAIIAGGGALIGALGGTGASRAIVSLTDADGFVYWEASKLLCYCRSVLLGRFGDVDSARKIQISLNERVIEMETTLESLKRDDGETCLIECSTSDDGESALVGSTLEIDTKKQAKVLARSLKYLKRCNEELAKAITRTARKQEV